MLPFSFVLYLNSKTLISLRVWKSISSLSLKILRMVHLVLLKANEDRDCCVFFVFVRKTTLIIMVSFIIMNSTNLRSERCTWITFAFDDF